MDCVSNEAAATFGQAAQASLEPAQRLLDLYRGLQAEVVSDHAERVTAANRLRSDLDQWRASCLRQPTR